MKIIAIAALALSAVPVSSFAQTVLAPGTSGDAQGPAPFNYYGTGGSRVQQVYSSSFFNAPISLTSLSLRAYPGAAPSGFTGNTLNVSNVAINLSTTARGDETGTLLSSTYANNVGSNVSSVFSGPLTLSTKATGQGTQPFDYTINFQNPFLYDPSMGNLLLDVDVLGTTSGNGFGFLTFDTVNDVNDGIYSVVNLNSGTAATGTLSTAGAITLFSGTAIAGAVPEPASWAMMILGFSVMGFGLRGRRKHAMRVTYA